MTSLLWTCFWPQYTESSRQHYLCSTTPRLAEFPAARRVRLRARAKSFPQVRRLRIYKSALHCPASHGDGLAVGAERASTLTQEGGHSCTMLRLPRPICALFVVARGTIKFPCDQTLQLYPFGMPLQLLHALACAASHMRAVLSKLAVLCAPIRAKTALYTGPCAPGARGLPPVVTSKCLRYYPDQCCRHLR